MNDRSRVSHKLVDNHVVVAVVGGGRGCVTDEDEGSVGEQVVQGLTVMAGVEADGGCGGYG